MAVMIRGLDVLQRGLQKKADSERKLKAVVKHHGSQLQRRMQRNADFSGHMEGTRFVPPTGATKRSISLDIYDGGMTAAVGPGTEYSPYLEYGTRFMAPQPGGKGFVRPTLDDTKDEFLKDVRKVVEGG